MSRQLATGLLVATALLPHGIGAVRSAAAELSLGDAPYVLAQEAVTAPAYAAADAAYKAYSRGDYLEAVRRAREAAALAPDNAEYRRLLETAEAALRASERQRAFAA